MLLKNYGEAQIHLREFVRLFPENASILLARERLGECSRHLARKEQIAADIIRKSIPLGLQPDIKQSMEDRLRAHVSNQHRLLTEAVTIYQKLSDELHAQSLKRPLNDLEQTLIRRARFGIGECYLDGESYMEALEVFRKLQAQHRRTVEGFYGSLRVCSLVDVLRQPPARGEQVRQYALESLKMLNEDLKAMPADHEVFRMAGVSRREEWLNWVAGTQRKLTAPTPKATGPAFP
jgi:tetratricopeptide (TPR) repeat protein